jgi:hypothetical protein
MLGEIWAKIAEQQKIDENMKKLLVCSVQVLIALTATSPAFCLLSETRRRGFADALVGVVLLEQRQV